MPEPLNDQQRFALQQGQAVLPHRVSLASLVVALDAIGVDQDDVRLEGARGGNVVVVIEDRAS